MPTQLCWPDICWIGFFKLNFVLCTISLFGFGSFLDLTQHDLKGSDHDKLIELDRHHTSIIVMLGVVSSVFAETFFSIFSLDLNFAQKCKKCQVCIISENLECTHNRQRKFLVYFLQSKKSTCVTWKFFWMRKMKAVLDTLPLMNSPW